MLGFREGQSQCPTPKPAPYIHTHTYICIYVCIYIYVYVLSPVFMSHICFSWWCLLDSYFSICQHSNIQGLLNFLRTIFLQRQEQNSAPMLMRFLTMCMVVTIVDELSFLIFKMFSLLKLIFINLMVSKGFLLWKQE